LALGLIGALAVAMVMVALIGAAIAARWSAQTAADMGSLAAAQVLIDGGGQGGACEAARSAVEANGADMTACLMLGANMVKVTTQRALAPSTGVSTPAKAEALAGPP
jgi:secretion/DNA translocation related TadE-like protein